MKNQQNTKAFSLQHIKTEQFAVFTDNYTPKKETRLDTELQFKLDRTNKYVALFMDFEFVQGKKLFLKIQVSCHFRPEDVLWDTFLYNEGSQLVLPQAFLKQLADVTISTSRGILFAKTESTPFSAFIIPMLDVEAMITEDAMFDLQEE